MPLPGDIDSLALRLDVDGELRQRGGVELMMYQPDVILRELALFTTLEDGDIVMIGTPEGVGEIRAGQRFKARVLAGSEVLITSTWIAQ